jgi:cysteine desulfurase / selenocysteine lyase
LECDFYAFSGHKLIGPTGTGVLYGKRALLEKMPPYQGGGDMIASVRFEKTEYAELPAKFEAGTPNVAGVAGLGAAIDYLQVLGLERIGAYEQELLKYATERMSALPGVKIVGTAKHKSAVVSFVMDGVSTLDVGVRLDRVGICVRTGHHCCMPVMERFGLASTARASFSFYNTKGEVDALVDGLKAIALARSQKPEASSQKGEDGEIVYPGATVEGVEAAAEKLAEDFEFLGERDAKNEYVLELGAKLPALFGMLKQVSPRVQGCMAEVYMVGRKKPGEVDVFEFVADADAEIVRGLIAVLEKIYSGQRAKEVAGFDIEGFFGRIGLDQFITSQRRNGLAGMVKRIREMAETMAKTT